MSPDTVSEARRQVEVCNACRYCEGYCSVFPAITRQRQFSDADMTQLANLCHNCRGCYYACQYTEPHEFAINIPAVLAQVRAESWQAFIRPSAFAGWFQHSGVAIAIATLVGFTLVFAMGGSGADGNFYDVMPHSLMVLLFIPAFLLPLAIIGLGLVCYWRHIGGGRLSFRALRLTLQHAGRLKDLSGGQGQGCNFEAGDRYTNHRRWLHQATMYGFLLCFAATVAGTVMHYLFSLKAPYPLLSVPKLLGLPGGILLAAGTAGLAWLKVRAAKNLSAASVWGAEMAFVLLLFLVASSGLALYASAGSKLLKLMLSLHIGSVLAFFLLMPYTKMVHGFFRLAALLHEHSRRDRTG